jgi:hypothetical protein
MPLTAGTSWDLLTTIDTSMVSFLQLGNIIMVKGGDRFLFLTLTSGTLTLAGDISVDDGISLLTLKGDEYLIAKDASDQTLMRVFKAQP